MDPLEYIIELLKKYEKLKEEKKEIVVNIDNSENDQEKATLFFITYQQFQTELKTLKIMLEQK